MPMSVDFTSPEHTIRSPAYKDVVYTTSISSRLGFAKVTLKLGSQFVFFNI